MKDSPVTPTSPPCRRPRHAARLLLCAILHPRQVRRLRLGLRCFQCDPWRRRGDAALPQDQLELRPDEGQTEDAAARNPPTKRGIMKSQLTRSIHGGAIRLPQVMDAHTSMPILATALIAADEDGLTLSGTTWNWPCGSTAMRTCGSPDRPPCPQGTVRLPGCHRSRRGGDHCAG